MSSDKKKKPIDETFGFDMKTLSNDARHALREGFSHLAVYLHTVDQSPNADWRRIRKELYVGFSILASLHSKNIDELYDSFANSAEENV